MSMKFNILWFEDNEEWYKATKENIEEYLKEKNFVAEFKWYKDTAKIEDVTAISAFDLILVDFKLDHNTKGTNAIQAIREKDILSDALFYSSDGVDKIKREMGTDIFEGVYFSSKDEWPFENKAKKLIDKAVRRMEDIISTRGILVDSLSEFDEKLRSIIYKFCSSHNDTDKGTELDKYAYKLVVDQMKGNKEKCDEMNKKRFLINALENTYLIDSAKLARIVQHIFNKYYPQHKYRKNFYDTYQTKIINERNNLAHAKKEVDGTGLFYFEKDETRIVYDSSKCSEIRSNINSFDDEIEKMIELII